MSETPEHLKPIPSSRGFAVMPALRSPDLDDVITAYESSNADGPHVWVSIDPRDGIPRCELTAEDAWKFAEQLMTLVRNHYQGDARPVPSERAGDLFSTTRARASETDHAVDAWYVRVLDEDVHHTTEESTVNTDWTRDGRLIGVELLPEVPR